jgi:hypothetical protein
MARVVGQVEWEGKLDEMPQDQFPVSGDYWAISSSTPLRKTLF